MSLTSEIIQCFCVSFLGGGVNVGNDCCCWLLLHFACKSGEVKCDIYNYYKL